MAAIQMPTCTAPRPSSRNQPHLSINSKIPEKVTFPGSPIHTSFKSPGNNNMRFESSSPTASSNISPVQDCALHPDSPYEILTKSPSNSAPSLRLTLSNNGSDNSDGSAWGFIDQGTSSPGSAGANSRQQSLKNAERLQQAARSRLKPVLKRYVQQSTPRSSALITAHSDIDSGACALKVDNVPNLYSGSFECSGPQGEGNSIFHSLDNLLHPPDPAALQAFNNSPADSEEWFDLPRLNSIAGPGQLLNGRGFGGRSDARGSKQLAETVSGDSNLEVEDSCRQEVFSMDTVLNTEGDSSYRFWWLDRVLYSQNQVHSLDPKPLLGIPSSVGSPHFSWPNHIQTAAPLSNLGSQSNFEHAYGKQVNSAIASLKATLPRSSTSSKSSYSSLRAPSGLSVPPVTRPRGQKRPIEDHQYEVPKSTSTATYPAVRADLPGQYRESTSHTYSSKLILPQQGVSKKIRHQRLQSAAATNNISNIDRGFNFQPQLAATSQQTLVEPHLMPFSMDCKSFTHEQPEAENFNPSTGRGSAEYLALPNCTTQHPQPVIDMPPQPHVDQHSFYFEGFHHENQRYHPSQVNVPANYVNTWNNSGLGFGLLSTPGREGVSVSPIISVQDTDANMEESHVEDGSEINSFHLDSYGQWGPRGDIDGSSNYAMSSNQVSPSPVNTPNESPGLGPTLRFGPPRPPPPHLTVQHPHCNVNSLSNFPYVNEDTNASYPNASLGGNLQWVQDQAAAAVVAGALSDWTTTPCFYPQQLESMALGKQDSGEDYEAEDERFDVDNEPDTARTHFHHGLPQKKRRRPFENDRRIAVHNVRKLGACVRCQYLRESCDEESPCGKCREVGGKQKIWGGFGCIRLRITEAQLFRKGNSKFKQERALPLPPPNWKEHVEKKYLILGRPPPIAVKYWGRRLDYPTLRIRCQEFIPRKDDLLFETWNEDGEEIRLEIPAFAACELEDVSIAVRNYVRETFDLFKYDMLSEEHNPLIRLVFQEAIRYTETHQCVKEKKEGAQQEACMLKDALKIWILTRLAYEGFTIISGNEEFGVNVINNPKSPYNGTVPIPPILDHQLDTVGIQEMIRLKANVLKALKARIQKRRTIQWYEVFLTIFVLLHNLEYISRKQYFYMKRHEGTWASNGERSIDFFREKWLAEWETAANMLIKHFQVALKGSVPFTFNWQGSDDGNDGRGGDGAKAKGKGKGKRKADPVAEAKERAGMDEAGVKFMREVCELVHAQEADFQKLRQDSDMRRYDNELVWVSQLFLDV